MFLEFPARPRWFPLLAIFLHRSKGCHQETNLNRITFLPNLHDHILYYFSSNQKCDADVEEMYKNRYRIVKTVLNQEDKLKLCDNGECYFYDTRFENDHFIWLFLCIGYVTIGDSFFNFLFNWSVLYEFNLLHKWSNVSVIGNDGRWQNKKQLMMNFTDIFIQSHICRNWFKFKQTK